MPNSEITSHILLALRSDIPIQYQGPLCVLFCREKRAHIRQRSYTRRGAYLKTQQNLQNPFPGSWVQLSFSNSSLIHTLPGLETFGDMLSYSSHAFVCRF